MPCVKTRDCEREDEVLAHNVNIWKPATQDVSSRTTKTQFSLETNYLKKHCSSECMMTGK